MNYFVCFSSFFFSIIKNGLHNVNKYVWTHDFETLSIVNLNKCSGRSFRPSKKQYFSLLNFLHKPRGKIFYVRFEWTCYTNACILCFIIDKFFFKLILIILSLFLGKDKTRYQTINSWYSRNILRWISWHNKEHRH